MQRVAFPLLIITLAGCGSDKPAPAEVHDPAAVARLVADGEAAGRAMTERNHGALADLTHPSLLEKVGGRVAFIRMIEKVAAEMAGQGFSMNGFTLSPPSVIVERRGRLYAILPYTLAMSAPDGSRGTQPASLVAISADGGANWKFVDGAGLADDPSKLRQLFPDFPEALALPKRQLATWVRP